MRPWQSVSPAAMGIPAPRLPRSKGKNPTTSEPSLRTATRALARNSPTAIANSGDRNGLARDGVLDCMARQEAMSSGPNSPGRTTEPAFGSSYFHGGLPTRQYSCPAGSVSTVQYWNVPVTRAPWSTCQATAASRSVQPRSMCPRTR